MALLCFVLDLRSLSPHLLRDLKQSLLQLANLYVASCARGEKDRCTDCLQPLQDRFGLCYLRRSKASFSSPELKIAYRPRECFSLRDFHHAVNSLPMDSFLLPELIDSISTASDDQEFSLASILNDKELYSWGGEYVQKKVISIGCHSFPNSKAIYESLADAAERCVTVEFVILEHEGESASICASEKFKAFTAFVNDLENCVLRKYLPDACVLGGLVKRWLQEVRYDAEETVQAVFLFKDSFVGSTNQIICNLFASCQRIIDGFQSCQTCRCHGYLLDNKKTKRSSCPLTGLELEPSDLIDDALSVGDQTVLFLPSFDGYPKLHKISHPVTFNVLERTNLASLNEGAIAGTSFVVTPSASHEIEAASDECNSKSELNIQLFDILCGALFHLDQGLVCSSTCNTETMKDGIFQSFYILQPSDKGPMLLRRLAASEEILPIPEISRPTDLGIPEEVENAIHAILAKLVLRDYNPLQHERGLHSKLNWLVKESLGLGFIPKRTGTTPKVKLPSLTEEPVLKQPLIGQASDKEAHQNQNEENASSSVSVWEELFIIDDLNGNYSASSSSKPKKQCYDSPAQVKPLDENTSRILERLEAPKQQRLKTNLPSTSSNLVTGSVKKPVLPFEPNSSQPLKPNFQRPKRKQR